MYRFFLLFFFLPAVLVAQIDTIAPTIKCKTGEQYVQIVNTNPAFYVLTQDSVLESVSDDSGVPPKVTFRYVNCIDTGIPTDTFTYVGIGNRQNGTIEVWAQDTAGNTDSCHTRILLFDNGFFDNGQSYSTKTQFDSACYAVEYQFRSGHCLYDSLNYNFVAYNGSYGGYGVFPHFVGSMYSVRPHKSINPKNGVDTTDLRLIQAHLLGNQPFSASWQYVAADANMDGDVTPADIVLLQQLLEGYIDSLPSGQSWRFVVEDDNQTPAPIDPFLPPLVEQFDGFLRETFYGLYLEFRAIKIGDIDGNADPKL